ncbi:MULTISPECIES: hypothetical protein [Streptomyces]|uniref:Uncharacterized protein n=1 Tax=Streptomyces chartreusis NRRL 3882 TaxID=1079985 RepID=A0A2N9B1U7_STRCX|nr:MULTISPECIES: hypothetical protein [Streptomyces]MYS93559.1 hypothetical protein [Streptomyces sp. SID5464]SOR77319.1 hypothetical protein SCNRRL3882_0791 [Streptomyces chartreusis NRRL 3882]
MHRTARTAPGTSSARPRVAVLAILAAVLLVLPAALGIAGPPPGTTGEPVTGAVAAVGRHGDTGPRADDGCHSDTACAVRAAPRQEPHSEHPAPRGHLATCGRGTDITPADGAARRPAPAAHVPSSDAHAPRDRGRAPPATSGI